MILFRTQASEKIGFGHIKRSAYLASLIKKNNDIVFILNKDKVLINFVRESGFNYFLVSETDKINWDVVNGIIFDIRTIEKHDKALIEVAKERNIKTVQITDLGLSQIGTDLLFNCSLDTIIPLREESELFSGLRYIILHNKFIHFNRINRKYRKKIKNILISLGGGVRYRVLRDIVDILYRNGYNLKITGGFYLKKSSRKILRRIYPKIKFTGKVQSLARALFETDIAVIAAGTTAYEAAAVGSFGIYFYYNKEQKFIAESLQNKGLGIAISDIEHPDKERLLSVLKDISLKDREQTGEIGKGLVDGKGVFEIIRILSEHGIMKK